MRWILPHELETPHRPTSSGMQSPMGAPDQFGPSPQTREYTPPPPCHIPPAQWGDVNGRAGDDGCELFGGVLTGDDQDLPFDPLRTVQCPDEIANASPPSPSRPSQPLMAARGVDGNLVRPDNAEEEPPSTACRQSIVTAPGGVSQAEVLQDSSSLQVVYEAEVYLHHHHRHLQHQCPMLRQHPVQPPIHCRGHH